ncbi:RNA polymerase-binding protein DksA [Variovorax sp. KK3]|uniref:RNA polymerase-binding protein DksA n=1 Tax=Variovorax sp. KK3 TaxID=1855728 RepID=UPI00211918B3|nr:RNA polymerase-binding protein DksA [Variovorax sp. KK3]
MKKPVAKATPVSKPAVKKTAVAKQAVPAAKKVSASHSDRPAAPSEPAAVSKAKANGTGASSSTHAAGHQAAAPASTNPVKKAAPAAAATPAMTTPTTPTPPSTTASPPRAARASSRLSQVTVPSMPQSVASTAAKSSFVQVANNPLVPPPPIAVKKDPKLANNWKSKTPDELTDAEVIAMPDSEYMNDKQMAFFRLKLQALKRGILENAGETTEHLREDTVVVPDPADRATIEEEHALELRTRDRERKLLKKIEQSIQRIDAGDYGYCDETGEPIGVGRLLARPTATLSLEAQQRRELKQKMFGD